MFDEQFFNDIGLEGLTQEEKQQLGEQLAELVQSRVALRLAEVLSPEQADRFTDMMGGGREVEAYKYLDHVYPSYGDVLAEEINRAKDELLQDMQVAADHLKDVE